MFLASLDALLNSQVAGIGVPKSVQRIMVAVLVIVLIRHGLNLSGYLLSYKPAETIATNVIGMPLARYAPYIAHPKAGVLYVIGVSTCPSCNKAEGDLRKMKLHWQRVRICSVMDASGGCFNGRGLNFAMPMLLICDRRGVIVYQTEGWDRDPGVLNVIKTQLERSISL